MTYTRTRARYKVVNTVELIGQLSALSAGRHPEDGVTAGELARQMRMARSTMRLHLGRLADQGLLRTTRGPNQSTGYVLVQREEEAL